MGGAERAHLGNQQKMEGFAMSQKVLIVEDDSNIAELLHLYLEKEGFETKVAKDGWKGCGVFPLLPAEPVLLDIMLPIMDGWTVLKRSGMTPPPRHHAHLPRGRRRTRSPAWRGSGRLYRQAL